MRYRRKDSGKSVDEESIKPALEATFKINIISGHFRATSIAGFMNRSHGPRSRNVPKTIIRHAIKL